MRKLLAIALMLTTIGCSDTETTESEESTIPVDGKADRFDKLPGLVELQEHSLEDLFEHPDTSRFEASGVAVSDGRVFIVFDNLRRFVSLDLSFEDPIWLGDSRGYGLDDDPRVEDTDDFAGFEGIAVNPETRVVSLAVEAMETIENNDLPVVIHWTEQESTIEWLEYEVEALNKGIEGLAYLQIEDQMWMAALCETGKCDGRTRGRLILRDEAGELSTADLPKGLDFVDFSGLAIDGNRVAAISQESSAIWVGEAFINDEGEIDFETEGVYTFPKQRDGDTDFCTVEGVAWLSPTTLVTVSDLEKDGQANRCENHAEELHVFELP